MSVMAPESCSRRSSAAPPGTDTSSTTGIAREVDISRLVMVATASSGSTVGTDAVVLSVQLEHTYASVPHGAKRLATEISTPQTEHSAF
tara:strand:+ start:317 stop:583 length:267 start_codon:yes stop_codon:yes gene_type:complete